MAELFKGNYWIKSTHLTTLNYAWFMNVVLWLQN